MKYQMVLSLTSEQMTLEVVKAAPAAFRSSESPRRLLPFRKVSALAVERVRIARVVIPLSPSIASLSNDLEQACTNLKKVHEPSLKGYELEVHLGLAHTRLGLLLADASLASMGSRALDDFTRAWVQQVWHIDPAGHVVRWQQLGNESRLLVSAVDRQVFASLEAFSHQHGLLFASCKPAVLAVLNEQTSTEKAITVVWTEPGITDRRSSVVQLLRFEGSQLRALWRGWVPHVESTDGADTSLQGAIRRFLAYSRAQPGELVRRQHWPIPLPTVSVP